MLPLPLIPLVALVFAVSAFAQTTPEGWAERLAPFKWNHGGERQPPPGLEHGTYFSEANEAEVGYYINLPLGYEDAANTGQRYPVVYFLHGGRPGAEYKSFGGYLNFNAMRAGKAMPPHIFVGVNGGRLSHYDYGDGALGVQAFLELVEHVDATYRTIVDRNGRALIGGSQGGRGVGRYLFRYADRFATGVSIAGGHQRELIISENDGDEQSGIVIPDGTNNVFDNARAYAERGNEVPPVNLMIVIGDEDGNYVGNLQWSIFLRELGINHELMVVPGTGHGIDFDIENSRNRVWRWLADGLGE